MNRAERRHPSSQADNLAGDLGRIIMTPEYNIALAASVIRGVNHLNGNGNGNGATLVPESAVMSQEELLKQHKMEPEEVLSMTSEEFRIFADTLFMMALYRVDNPELADDPNEETSSTVPGK